MASCLFLNACDDNSELWILCQHPINPKCNDAQTVNSQQWLKQNHLGERYAYKTCFVCVSKVFNETNKNVLRMCNDCLKVWQSADHNISMKFIFV